MDDWAPYVIPAAVTLAVLLANRWWAQRDRRAEDSADVARARIDDGSLLRRELWDRLTKLEADLTSSRAEAESLRAQVIALTTDLRNARDELAAARGEVRGLLAQITALRAGG